MNLYLIGIKITDVALWAIAEYRKIRYYCYGKLISLLLERNGLLPFIE
jgi:hypothetical protein